MVVCISAPLLAASLLPAPREAESMTAALERAAVTVPVAQDANRRVTSGSKLDGLGPLAGGIVGGAFMWKFVHEEGDLTAGGKALWIGIGTVIGAGAGWLIERLIEK